MNVFYWFDNQLTSQVCQSNIKINKITIEFMSNEVKAYSTVTHKQMLAVQDVRPMVLSMLIHCPFKRVNHT